MRIAYLGNTLGSSIVLRRLARADGIEIALVVSRTPRPGRRGSDRHPTPVADEARTRGLALLEADRVADAAALAAIRAARPDALAVVAFGEILSTEVLRVPALGAVNVHFSLLPRWRGAAPVQRAIMAGDEVTGVTTMLMDEGLDTGPILLQRPTPIGSGHTAGTLGVGLAAIGGDLLAETLGGFDRLEPRTQDPSLVTYAPKIKSEERRIDWRSPAVSVERLVRALSPAPGAVGTFRDASVKVLLAEVGEGSGDPGTVVDAGTRDAVAVAAADGVVYLRLIVAAGRAAMSGGAWARGARVRAGERFT